MHTTILSRQSVDIHSVKGIVGMPRSTARSDDIIMEEIRGIFNINRDRDIWRRSYYRGQIRKRWYDSQIVSLRQLEDSHTSEWDNGYQYNREICQLISPHSCPQEI